jgi:hypothetical protein
MDSSTSFPSVSGVVALAWRSAMVLIWSFYSRNCIEMAGGLAGWAKKHVLFQPSPFHGVDL